MTEKESERLKELRRRLELYRNAEEEILTGGSLSYNIGGRALTRYGMSLSELKAAIKEIEEEINGIENGSARWSGNLYPADD